MSRKEISYGEIFEGFKIAVIKEESRVGLGMQGTTIIIAIDILTIIFIVKDERYFFDDEKFKLILLVLFLPIIGALYVVTKLRDDIKWYVGISGVLLAITCATSVNRWTIHACIEILASLGKVLSW